MAKVKCIVGSFIVFVVVIVAGVGMYYAVTLNGQSESEDIHPDVPAAALLASTTDGRILGLYPDTGNYTTLVVEDSPIECFAYFNKYQVLFYATAEPDEPIKLMSLGYKLPMNYSANWTKTAMAIDYFQERLYVLDGLAETLYMIDLSNGNSFVYLADLDKPRDVIVYTERSVMFVLQETSILILNMQTRSVDVSNRYYVNAFAADRLNDQLYYASDESIAIMDYRSDKTVHYDQRCVLSMTAYQGHPLYIDNPKNGSERSLIRCYEGCASVETVEIADLDVTLLTNIKAFDLIAYAD